MIQFNVLSGKMAGTQTVARRFPFHIGREAGVDLRLEDPGVWDRHARVDFKKAEGISLTALGEALVSVNDQSVRETVLRNGDRLAIGSVQLRFWLAETRQRGLGIREFVVWACVLFVTLGQLALLYWLLQ
jgi:hypothetical protein